jgi:signal transduction histidine kinase
MPCPRCQHENPSGQKFCGACGMPLTANPPGPPAPSYSEIANALTEALEQQTATGEILRVISSSPTDIQPVMDAVAASAARLCGATDAAVRRVHGDFLETVAVHGPPPWIDRIRVQRDVPSGRAVIDAVPIHVHDVVAAQDEFPGLPAQVLKRGGETLLAVPLLRGGVAIGVISIRRLKVLPFTEKEIALLQTFANQAVIAIENVRLFTELQEKNRALAEAHANVTEALEQRTATADILKVISSSPTNVQPVFEAIAESAARLTHALFGGTFLVAEGMLNLAAIHTPDDVADAFRRSYPIPLDANTLATRVAREGLVVNISDAETEPSLPEPQRRRVLMLGARNLLIVPMVRDAQVVGMIIAGRREPGVFTDKQVTLLETFANQAVIAIENVRLFNETKEALEQQTATAEILRVIASSPTDLQPVMEAVAENAARVCGATDSAIFRLEGEHLRLVARRGPIRRYLTIGDTVPVNPSYVGGRAVCDRRTIHVADIRAAEAEFPETVAGQRRVESPTRTMLATPLLREGTPLGVIVISRGPEVHPFSAKQISLLETFANQAVIAIENVRLFQELRARTAELTRSVEQLTALGEVGRAVSSTLDLDTVLDTIVTRANQLAGTDGCSILEYDEAAELFRLRASRYADPREAAALDPIARATPIPKGQGVAGRAALHREAVHIPDIAVEGAYESPVRAPLLQAGYRALLGVPLLREEQVIGVLTVIRKTPGDFAPEVVRVLTTFAVQSALAIQNARLFHEIANKSRQLEAASRHKSEFLANMSHELRTPLNAILGFSEVLAERMFGEVNAKQAEYLQDILSSGRHLLSLINDILDLAKVEAGRLELELGRFHLPTALDNALTLVRERATRHGITLTHSVDPGVADIVADERKVKQILLNLLSNAIKFTREGGQVALTATTAADIVTIAVTDTGVGIAPEDQAAIFEEFRQVGGEDARTQEGTGLGLTLARKFVELHRGRIGVQSQVGQGSTFSFTLPVRLDERGASDQGGGEPPRP